MSVSKKIISLFVLLIFTFSLIACKKNNIPKGSVLSHDFIIDEMMMNNALFQQNNELIINGEAEKDAVIIGEIVDEKNNVISINYSIGDEKGLYKITLSTPKGSNKIYQINIYDEEKKYIHQYSNIRFGELFLIIGENFVNRPLKEELSSKRVDELYESLAIYDYSYNGGDWIEEYSSSDVTDFMYEYYQLLYSFYKYPIGFVKVCQDEVLIEELLSLEDVKSNSSVKAYLEVTGRYYEAPYQTGQMSYLYNQGLKKIFNMTYNTIIFDSGLTDLININKNVDIKGDLNIYTKMLYLVIKNLNVNFKNRDRFIIIQKPSININNVGLLRNIEDLISNYFVRIDLLPTYDLLEVKEESSELMTNNDKIVERLYDIVNGKKIVSGYANLICEYNDEEVCTSIRIEFSDTMHVHENNEYDGLLIFDKNKELITPQISCFYNQIVIDLSYEIEVENEEGNIEIQEAFYEVSQIAYAQANICNVVGLVNAYKLPIVPFIININEVEDE